MPVSAAPSLSTHGWIHDTAPMFDYLYSQFLLAQRSQSSTFVGQVSSLSWLIGKNQNDPISGAGQIELALSNYLSAYYENVVVTCTSELLDPANSETKVKFTLRINFTHKGVRHDASKLLEQDGGSFKEIAELNNG